MHCTRVASARKVFLGRPSSSTDERVQLENSFFKSLCLANGSRKTTAPARLTDVDETVCKYFAHRKAVRLLDVGISSGVTTIELLNCFESQGIHVSGVGMDICVHAVLRTMLGCDVLYDSAGNVLQVATPLFARGRPHRTQTSLQSRLLRMGIGLLESSLARKAMAGICRSRPLSMVSPRLLERRDFEVVEHDMRLPRPAWEESFDLVRIANVLNHAYSCPSVISGVLKNVMTWIKKGGYLLVCRTDENDGSNIGSLYCRLDTVDALQLVHSFGPGFELDRLIHEL